MGQVFINSLPVSATIETDEQGATCIKMPTSEVDVRLWARVSRSAGFRVVYQYTMAAIVSIAYASIQRQIIAASTARASARSGLVEVNFSE